MVRQQVGGGRDRGYDARMGNCMRALAFGWARSCADCWRGSGQVLGDGETPVYNA